MVASEKVLRQRKEDSEAKSRARSGRRSGSVAGSSSGGSRERSRRHHDDADREAKRRAKRSSGGGEEAKPGAALEKTSSRSLGSRRSSRRSNRDDEDRATKQRARSGGSRSRRPGVESVATSDDSTEDRIRRKQSREDSSRRPRSGASSSRRSISDEKAKERRGTRAAKPGAEASTSSRDRSRAKSGGRNNSERSANVAANEGAPQFNEDGEAVVAATLIEGEKEDEHGIKERERARIREIERERLQKEAENERLEREEAERQEKELEEKKKNKKKKRNMVICVILVVLVIGGGAAAFFALQGTSSSDEDAVTQTTIPQEEAPVPSSGPTDDPSSAPTNVPLKYEQPGPMECERIASGLPIDGEDEMFDRSFAIAMDVNIWVGNDIDPLVPELETQIEKLLVPDLIGCPRGLFNKRRLGLHHGQNQASMSSGSYHHRQLQNMSIRYAIAKAIVSVTLTDDACERSSSPNCRIVTVTLDLKVRGNENIGLLAEVIQSFFPNGEDIRPAIELIAPFDTIVIGVMRSLDPTTAPSIAPTGTASENPSVAPSSSLSTSPTSGLGTGPTDPVPVVAPTKAPSKSPSKAPTPPPTLAPTATPPPTVAPQPGLTPQPTPPPTKSPTKAPTKSPTKAPTKSPTPPPTLAPQPGLTPQPTPQPTIALSMSPSRYPSPEPSLVPSTAPSTKPSLMPSEGPTIQASLAPSPMPSSDPSSGPTPAGDLYCGCFLDPAFIARDLNHISPTYHLSQVGCINYCTSRGYSFAGLQWNLLCWCGHDAGSYGTSLNCFTVDKDRDGNPDVCVNSGVGACYDGSNSCSCGGGDANLVFRTSQAVSCPPQVPPTVPNNFLGCFEDDVARDLNVFGFKDTLTVEMCRSFCRDSGFAYSSIQSWNECFCGNSYANIRATPTECTVWWRNAVYWSGAAMAQVADLDQDLYCGCFADSTSQRVSEYMYTDNDFIGQKGCIYYCRSQGYDYAGLRNHKCFCRADPGSYSTSQNCNTGCVLSESACCYDGSDNCSVGGQVGSDLFQDIYRTRSGIPCP